jgi:hypothetical protein
LSGIPPYFAGDERQDASQERGEDQQAACCESNRHPVILPACGDDVMMCGMDDEAKTLLREIRDVLVGSEARGRKFQEDWIAWVNNRERFEQQCRRDA